MRAYFAVPAGAFAVPAARAVGVSVVVSLRGSDVPGFAQGRLDGPLGDGALRGDLEAEAGRLGVAGNMTFEGRLAQSDIPGALRSADVFAMTSAAEGMSNALLEAMASGSPVLTTRNGSDDVVTAADAGFVVEVDDRAGFEARLDELCARPELRDRLARNGLAYARTMTWEVCASGFLELVSELAGSAGRSPRSGDGGAER